MDKPLSLGPVTGTSSLFRTSEGLTLGGLLALVTTICTGDYDPGMQKWAILALGIATGCYAISRGMAKRG